MAWMGRFDRTSLVWCGYGIESGLDDIGRYRPYIRQ